MRENFGKNPLEPLITSASIKWMFEQLDQIAGRRYRMSGVETGRYGRTPYRAQRSSVMGAWELDAVTNETDAFSSRTGHSSWITSVRAVWTRRTPDIECVHILDYYGFDVERALALVWSVLRLFELDSAYAPGDAVAWLLHHEELWNDNPTEEEYVWHGDVSMRGEEEA